MGDFIFLIFQNSLIMSAAVLLMIFLSRLFHRKIKSGVKVICWLVIAVGFIIPLRPAVFSIPEPSFVPAVNDLPLLGDFFMETASGFSSTVVPEISDISAAASWKTAPEIYESQTASGYYTEINVKHQDTFSHGTTAGEVTETVLEVSGKISFDEIIRQIFRETTAVLGSLSIQATLLYCWILGVFISLILLAKNQFGFIRKIKNRKTPVIDPVILMITDDVRNEIKLKRKLNLFVCQQVTTPVTVGLFHPTIILPAGISAGNGLRFILMHEALHIKRGDIWCKLLFLAVKIIHWFNPVVYLMNRAVDTEIEMACDAAVLKYAGEEQRKNYGKTVFQTAKRNMQPAATLLSAFAGNGKDLKRRISAILDSVNTKRWVAVCCAVILFVGAITGGLVSCSRSEDSANPKWESTITFDPPEFFYLMDFVDLPEDLPGGASYGYVSLLASDLIYLTAWVKNNTKVSNGHSELEVRSDITILFSFDINNGEVTRLPGFSPTVPPEEVLSGDEAMTYSTDIYYMVTDNEGNLWLTENVIVSIYDFPIGIDLAETDREAISEFRQILHDYTVVRKLDKTGADIIEPIPVSETLGFKWDEVRGLNVDSQGNLYLSLDNLITVFDPGGNVLFDLKGSGSGSGRDRLVRLPNGNVADTIKNSNSRVAKIQEIDAETGAWARTFELNTYVPPILGNSGQTLFYSYETTRLMSYNIDEGLSTEILNCNDTGINALDVVGIDVLEDGRIMLVTQAFNYEKYWFDTQIIHLTKVAFEDLQDRTLLTLATLRLDNKTREAVTAFNKASPTHFIQVIDYSVYETWGENGWMAAFDQLSLDITTGRIPDMIALSPALPMQRYAAMGLLEDLYPFIDDDPEFDRNCFVEGVLQATETDGRLYRLFPYFSVHTIIGNPYFVGENPGWDMDEFQAVLRNNPGADKPLGNWVTSGMLFELMLSFYMDRFIDWKSGTADFDNDIFIRLLESMAFLPPDTTEDSDYLGDPELIATGRQIMYLLYLVSIEQYQVYRTVLGGDIVFKGFPSDNTAGNFIQSWSGVTMTSTCKDKNGAWDFIRTFLNEDWQRRNLRINFPVNKVVFDEMLAKAIAEPEFATFRFGEFEVPSVALTQAEANQLREMISNTANTGWRQMDLWNIISEETSMYFRGLGTAQDAARIIQNRASTLMSEQVG